MGEVSAEEIERFSHLSIFHPSRRTGCKHDSSGIIICLGPGSLLPEGADEKNDLTFTSSPLVSSGSDTEIGWSGESMSETEPDSHPHKDKMDDPDCEHKKRFPRIEDNADVPG